MVQNLYKGTSTPDFEAAGGEHERTVEDGGGSGRKRGEVRDDAGGNPPYPTL